MSSALSRNAEITPDRALHAAGWLDCFGGIAVWGCEDLATPDRCFYTPAKLTDGSPSPRPHWSATHTPVCILTDAEDIDVVERREFKRLRIAVRNVAYGTPLQLTDASRKRLESALDAAGSDASYAFEGNQAVVYTVAKRVSLTEWLKEHGHA